MSYLVGATTFSPPDLTFGAKSRCGILIGTEEHTDHSYTVLIGHNKRSKHDFDVIIGEENENADVIIGGLDMKSMAKEIKTLVSVNLKLTTKLMELEKKLEQLEERFDLTPWVGNPKMEELKEHFENCEVVVKFSS